MSRFGNRGVRCDWCGKFSTNQSGEYIKPDGVSAGYIRQPEWERNHVDASGDNDICEECVIDCCTFCGSDQLVKITPLTPGPTGWGFRCKSCDKQWMIPARPADGT